MPDNKFICTIETYAELSSLKHDIEIAMHAESVALDLGLDVDQDANTDPVDHENRKVAVTIPTENIDEFIKEFRKAGEDTEYPTYGEWEILDPAAIEIMIANNLEFTDLTDEDEEEE